MEFAGSTPAIWSFSPTTNSADLQKARDLIKDRCERRPSPHSGLSEEEKGDSSKKEDFSEALDTLKKNNVPLSWTEISYRIGFVAMTLLFAVLFVTFFVANTSRPEGQDIPFRLLMAALFFATFWPLMRITFLIEKLSLYPDDPLLGYNYGIFCVFAAPYIYLVSIIWTRLKLSEQLGSILLSALSPVVNVVIGLPVSYVHMNMKWVPEMLVSLFGTGSSFSTYIAVILLLLIFHFFFHFPYILDLSANPKRQGRGDRDQH